ncbi:class I SAM-dependent methyltransferase [Bacillus sp. JJ1609]|uniref:class I SAM-dependent methyltransferase n=1 Tax=Bacillus sp. JJ1609 TaxID=3122977 RepID=UPI0030002957
MNNSWNAIIYKGWAPIYDWIFDAGPFSRAREKLFNDVQFQPGDRILFVGVGTGVDINRLPDEKLSVTAIDYSEDMLQKAQQKFSDSDIEFLKMDAQQLDFLSESFDYVVGSLILSVVPDSNRAFEEMARVCRINGTILIFDKFAEPGIGLSRPKKLLRHLIKVLGTDIGISFEALYQCKRTALTLLSDEGIMFGGMYRKITLKKVQ